MGMAVYGRGGKAEWGGAAWSKMGRATRDGRGSEVEWGCRVQDGDARGDGRSGEAEWAERMATWGDFFFLREHVRMDGRPQHSIIYEQISG
jgi:hypothetical protein